MKIIKGGDCTMTSQLDSDANQKNKRTIFSTMINDNCF